MNCKNSIIRLLGAAFLLGGVATSCFNYDEIPLVKLAALENEIIVEVEGGSFELSFYANSAYHIEYLNEADWFTMTVDETVGEMASLTGTCTPNESFKRAVSFVLCSDLDTRRDTVAVKQKAGIEAFISIDDASIILPGEGGTTVSPIHTNVPYEEMSVEIVYDDADNADWVTFFEVVDSDSEDRELTITTDGNTNEDDPRVATVYLSYIDGWGDAVSVNFNLLQCNAKGEAFSEISYEELLEDYATGTEINKYIGVKGIIVSSRENGNAGEPEQKTTSTIDFTASTCAVYLEAEDGHRGLNILTATEDDNIFDQFDRVSILLHGTTIALMEENLPCYQITGLTKSMVISRTSGTVDDVPVKERTMATLTDDDFYTYVKLTNVELPIRKGSLFPVDGTFTSANGNQRITKYPTLVRDINGDDMYLLTNENCAFHRDGTRLPYGSGSLYGVVVHEHYSRFEWRNGADPADIYEDETLANIGRYQLRPQSKDDIWRDMNDDFEDGFSALLCEYRYRVFGYRDETSPTIDVPSYGTNGWLTHTYQRRYTGASAYGNSDGTCFQTGNTTYDYLGPIGRVDTYIYGQNRGNKNGLGIIIDPEHENTDYGSDRFAYNNEGKLELACQYAENEYCGYGAAGWTEANSTEDKYINVPNSYSATSNAGRGWTASYAQLDYSNTYWWDDNYDRPYGYLLNVSTADVVSSVVSLQLSIRSAQSTFYTPRYWSVKWSLEDETFDESQWSTIAEFTLPDLANTNSPSLWQISAYKTMNFTLPQSILGHENVYIRIAPTSDICGSGLDYADAQLKESSRGAAIASDHAVSISYIAIRYNK